MMSDPRVKIDGISRVEALTQEWPKFACKHRAYGIGLHHSRPGLFDNAALCKLRKAFLIEARPEMGDDNGLEEDEPGHEINNPSQRNAALATFRAKNNKSVFADTTDISTLNTGVFPFN